MRRLPVLFAMLLSASPALAQDSVIVRHITPSQDTAVVVRHLPAAQDGTPLVTRIPPPPPNARPVFPLPRPLAFRLPPKDPGVGTMLSIFFPGGGQFYAGAEGKGAALMFLGLGAPIAGLIASQSNTWNNGYSNGRCNGYESPFGFQSGSCHGYNPGPAEVGIGIGAAAWLVGVATAGTDVEHWNQAHGVRFVAQANRVGVAIPFP
jgi:hypothetical protein